MAEPFGLAIGVASLAGIFTSCIDCFEYVQLGRSFGKDYEKCLLRLDVAKLQMSRWGASLGLGSEAQPLYLGPQKELDVAQRLLQQIQDAFDDAEAMSGLFKDRTAKREGNSNDLVVYNASTDLEPEIQRLHTKIHEVAKKRQKETKLAKKIKWAIYKKREFDTMIESVTGFVHDLVELFPAARASQEILCSNEVSEIYETQDLALLGSIASKDDKILRDEVKKVLEGRGHSFFDLIATEGAKLHAGDNIAYGREGAGAGHTYHAATASGTGTDMHLGNNYWAE